MTEVGWAEWDFGCFRAEIKLKVGKEMREAGLLGMARA